MTGRTALINRLLQAESQLAGLGVDPPDYLFGLRGSDGQFTPELWMELPRPVVRVLAALDGLGLSAAADVAGLLVMTSVPEVRVLVAILREDDPVVVLRPRDGAPYQASRIPAALADHVAFVMHVRRLLG